MPDRKPDPYPLVLETFREPTHALALLKQGAPDCHNGKVSVTCYRITIERIDEPPDVIRNRIHRLWRELPYNGHQSGPLRAEAAKYGLTLEADERAEDAPKPRKTR